MHAIVTAGGATTSKDPLYEITRGGLKSMINIHGKPMVQWVLDALGESQNVDRVFLVGLPPETDLVCAKPLTLIDDQGSMLLNIRAGVSEIQAVDPKATHAILASGDLPALRAEIIDWLACQAQDLDQDIYYTVVERSTMETSFPGSRKNYTHLKDTQLCGGDLHCFRLQVASEDSPLWKQLVQSRKSRLRQASLLGYDTMFLVMLRRFTLQDAEAHVCRKLGIAGRAVLSPYPEVAMDVDKPFQLEILSDYLAKNHDHYQPAG